MQASPTTTYPEQVGFCTKNGSDKEYRIRIEVTPQGQFEMNAFNGRRGRCRNIAQRQLYNDFDSAKHAADSLRRVKERGGYIFTGSTPVIGSTPIIINPNKQDTGLRPQLPNAIRRDQALELIDNPDWCSQQKFNGVNVTFDRKSDGSVIYANKLGFPTTVPQIVHNEILKLPPMRVTGELIGDRFVAYDLSSIPGNYRNRIGILNSVFKSCIQSTTIFVARTAWTADEKKKLMEDVANANLEGEVYKYIYGDWKPGRPNSGGDQLKCKNWKSATCIVTGNNSPLRSVKIGAFGPDGPVSLGNVTVKANQSFPEVGSFIEVKYLDYFPGGSLTQPEFLFVRDDVDETACTLSQLISLGED